MVHPETRKGLVYVHQTDDSLIHFCWKERSSSTAEDDLIIFPDDAEFKRVPQCTTGRVYVLKFKSNPRRCFFWMQEPSDEKDDDHCKKINEYFNNPPTPGSRNAVGGSGREGRDLHGLDLGSLGDADLQNLLNNMNPQQLIQMLGGGGGGLASIFNNTSGGSAQSLWSLRILRSSDNIDSAHCVACPRLPLPAQPRLSPTPLRNPTQASDLWRGQEELSS